jgi:hypothetical protein
MTFSQMVAAVAVDTPTTPNLNTVIAGFALVCALFILRAVHRLYDQGIRHEGLPKMVKELSEKLDGVVKRFDAHCKEEEQWQKDAVEANALSARMTKAAIEAAEQRLGGRIEKLHERRGKAR